MVAVVAEVGVAPSGASSSKAQEVELESRLTLRSPSRSLADGSSLEKESARAARALRACARESVGGVGH
jgi:hypothetical protein